MPSAFTKNPQPHHTKSVTRPVLNPWAKRSRIFALPGQRGDLYALLQVLLSRLPEIFRKDSFSGRLRGRRGVLPALRRQECRAALVRLLHHHLQKERLKPASRSLA